MVKSSVVLLLAAANFSKCKGFLNHVLRNPCFSTGTRTQTRSSSLPQLQNSYLNSLSAPSQPPTEPPTEDDMPKNADNQSYMDGGNQQTETESITEQIVEVGVEKSAENNVEGTYETSTNKYEQIPTNQTPSIGTQAEAPLSSQRDEVVEVGTSTKMQSQGNKKTLIFDEEKFTTNLNSIVETTLKSSSSRSYMETKASFSISKSRNEKRLSRSIYEIEKTKENIRKIKQRANTNVMEAEKDLEEKLKEIQKKLDIEVDRIFSLLESADELERKRENQLLQLISSLKAAMIVKQKDIQQDETTTAEMEELRSKLDDGSISSQLDVVIAKKQALTSIDCSQLEDLNKFLSEAKSVLLDTRSRIYEIEETRKCLNVPLQVGNASYDFTQLEKMEDLWMRATDAVEESGHRIEAIMERYDTDRLNRTILLGGEIPPSLEALSAKVESQTDMFKVEKVNTGAQIKVNEKNEKELIGSVADSIGKAALGSAKAGVLGLKAFFETLGDKEVTKVTNEGLKKALDLSKLSSNVVNDDLKGGLKATGDTMGSVPQASDVLTETSNDTLKPKSKDDSTSK